MQTEPAHISATPMLTATFHAGLSHPDFGVLSGEEGPKLDME
jgi:hypothetical protein